MSKPETIKVRIALAVDPDGSWCAGGDATFDDDHDWDEIMEGISEPVAGQKRYWVVLEVPRPPAVAEPEEIKAGAEAA